MAREYKDSGIEWIGQIPKEWKVCRLKNVGSLYGGLTGKSGDDFNVEEDDTSFMLFIPFTNIFNNDSINPQQLYKVKVDQGETQNYVQKDDILFLMSSEDYEGVGKPAILEEQIDNLGLNSFCKGLHITDEKIRGKFLFYLLSSHLHRELIRQEAKGFIRINLRQDRLSCCPIFFPPLPEQEKIADYLDKVCGEADEMIALQEKMIEELKAYKQSIITEAVTKGLNPNVPMKNSGIDWIGEIPEHWDKDKIIRIFNLIGSGTTPSSSDNELYEGNLNWIQSGDINGGDLYESKNKISEKTLKKYSALTMYDAPFIIIAMYGASVGNISISHINGCVNQACCVMSETKQDFKYVFYAIKSAKDYLIYKAVGGGQPNISQSTLKQLWLPVPSLFEQQQIASFLDSKCSEIDSLIAIKQQKIAELREYKKSVIYEYVTGKKEVI